MHTSIVSVHGSTVHNSTVIDSVVHAVIKGIEFLKGSHTVNAMREERPTNELDENLFKGVVYDRINAIMEDARHGN